MFIELLLRRRRVAAAYSILWLHVDFHRLRISFELWEDQIGEFRIDITEFIKRECLLSCISTTILVIFRRRILVELLIFRRKFITR